MALFNLVRLGIFAAILLLSLIPLGIGANFTRDAGDESWPGFAVAVAVITLITIPAMLVVEHLRRGAVTSLVAAELGWVGVLMILWLATAAHTTDATRGVTLNCSRLRGESESYCRQYQALQAFSWIIWLLFLGYFATLLTFAILSHVRGNKHAWRTPTNELAASVAHGGNAGAEPKIPPPGTQAGQPYNAGAPATGYPPNAGGVAPQTTGGSYTQPPSTVGQQAAYGAPPYGQAQV